MDRATLLIGIIFIGSGSLFILKNQDIAKGASKFYAKLYTKKNLRIMFRAAGIILVLAGIYFLFIK